jgi:hypothetical protein
MSDKFMQELNNIFAEELGYSRKVKGTSTYYVAGSIENKSFCYTLAKTGYKGRWGFWSWIETSYKNGRTKRTFFAKSGNRKNAEARAKRLFEKYSNKKIELCEGVTLESQYDN